MIATLRVSGQLALGRVSGMLTCPFPYTLTLWQLRSDTFEIEKAERLQHVVHF